MVLMAMMAMTVMVMVMVMNGIRMAMATMRKKGNLETFIICRSFEFINGRMKHNK